MKASQSETRSYLRRARRHMPRPPFLRNAVAAFLVGGAICTVGQGVLGWFIGQGMQLDDAASPTAAVMVFLGALFTGIGVYDEVGRYGGMGGALPITGFANAIVAPALESRNEGYILGVGARMFSLAGPVIAYGLLVAMASAALRFWLMPS